MPGPQHPPIVETAKAERSSAPNSPRSTVAGAGSPTGRGGRSVGTGSAVTSSRGGRRHVHARVLPRANSANSLASPTAGSPTGTFGGEVTRNSAGSYLFPISPSYFGDRTTNTNHNNNNSNASVRSTDQPPSRCSSSDEPSTNAPTQRHADTVNFSRNSADNGESAAAQQQRRQQQREQQEQEEWLRRQQERERQQDRQARKAAKKQAMASLLADPERHRRAVATGSSNPLHVWDHETAFIKSRYFSATRRDNEKRYQNQKEQAEKYFSDSMTPETVAGAATWSRASSDQSPNSPSNGVHKRLLSGSNGHGGGGGGGDNNGDNNDGGFDGLGSYHLPSAGNSLMEKNEDTWAAQEHCRTRNMNALHAFSWDQRVFLPQRQGMLSSFFDLLASPRFWEKLDWTIRGSVLTILPTLILCLEPATQHIFPLPTSVVFLAYWTTQPTLGAGLRETFVVLKGFSISLVILVVIISINPGPAWVTLIILFCCLLVTGFVAEQLKRMVAYCFASLLMQYIAQPQNTGYDYVGNYYATILIGQGFGLASFLFPYIRWSSENARRYIVITGDAVSLSVHGACCSFWVQNSLLERQLHVARLRQLRHTIEASTKKAQQALSEMGYEPHSGVYSTRLKTRMAFLKNVFNVVQSMTLVIEQVAGNPALVETPMCREFGARIRGELNLIAAAMDSIILRIVDLDNLVSVTDMTAFRVARSRFEEAVSNVRDEVILSNPDYRTDNSDILLGFFLFSVEELMEIIGNFQDAAKPPSNLWYLITFPLRDLQSSWSAFVDLYNAIRIRRSITRRLKEAIKLSVCIIVAAVFQVYAMKSSSTSPVAGVDIIAFVYRSTGGESFQYSTMRMLGTVLGSLTGLLTVQIAQGHRPTLYGCTLVLTFIGSYVQAAPDYGALGNALANSVVSIVLQYKSQPNAITRIQQNCFAILIYFIISSVIWPVRGRTKVNTGLDVSLRMAREATDRLLRNLDLPDSATAVSADVLAVLGEMQKKVGQQIGNIPGAIAEPTLDSVGFPEMPWRMLIGAQRKLMVTLFMMRHAYHTFMTSTIADVAGEGDKNSKKVIDNADMIGAGPAAATSISVHWVVLHRISPYTRQLSQLFYEAVEVYLLTLSKATFVPTAELTRLRLGMMQCYDQIVSVYIDTIQHELNTSDEDESDGNRSDDGDNSTSDGDDYRAQRNHNNNNNKTSSGLSRTAGQGSFSGGSGAMALANVAGFVPPAPATFAPYSSTVGGAADTGDAFRNSNNSMRGVRNASMTGFKNNNSMRGVANNTFSGGSFRRTNSGTANTRSSSKKGNGHFSYKLTPEERQRLREYVLGPNSTGLANASFFANAAALAAAAEQGGNVSGTAANTVPRASFAANNNTNNNNNNSTSAGNSNSGPAPTATNAANAATNNNNTNAVTTGGGLPNQTFAGGFMSNHSMFNAAGSFWNRNVSMFDPGMLRNAGIMVQEPVHEGPRQRRDGSESAGRSSHHSLRNSFMPRSGGGGGGTADRSNYNNSNGSQYRGRRSSSLGNPGTSGNNVEANAAELEDWRGRSGESNNNNNNNAATDGQNETGQMTVSDQLSVHSEGAGSAMPTGQRRRSSSSPGSLHHSPSPQQPPLFTGRAQTGPSMLSHAPSAIDRSQGLAMKKSKTAKYAVPSVLQMSMVLPAGAYALRNPEALAAAANSTAAAAHNAGASASDSRTQQPQQQQQQPSSSLSIAVPAASRLDPLSPNDNNNNNNHTASSSQMARSNNATLNTTNGNQSFVSAGAGTAAAAAGDVFSLGRSARSAVRPHNPWSVKGLTGGSHHPKEAKGDGDHARRERVSHFAEESLHQPLSPGGWEREGDDGGADNAKHQRRRGSSRAASDAPTAAPSIGRTSPTKVKRDAGYREVTGELLSNDSHEPFEAKEVFSGSTPPSRSPDGEALDAVGSGLLCDPLQAHRGSTASAHANTATAAAAGPPENLLPSPIPAPGPEEERGGQNSSATRPFFNHSFTTAGPAIPDALRDYVEGLAEQQRQQVPPPPAILGNMSFINVTANLPVANRSVMGAGTNNNLNNNTAMAGSVFNGTFAGFGNFNNNNNNGGGGGGLGNSGTAAANSGTLSSGNMITSAPAAAGDASNTGAPAINPASISNALQADFMAAVGKLEFNNGTFCGTFRNNDRSATSGAGGSNTTSKKGGGEALLSLLDVGGTGGDSDDGGDEYVLTNSDIHSLEAFLFGLRVVITQVEELERYLLEVVHGNEMAAKL